MNIDLLNVKSISESIEICRDAFESLNLKRVKCIKIEDSLDYILAEDIIAREDLPAFRRSTMDGFAVNSSSTTGASDSIPAILNLAEIIEIGQVPNKSINNNQASQIFTGGMLPEGANAVVPIEYAEFLGDSLVSVYKAVSNLQHVIEVGDDCQKGEIYFKKGEKISPAVVAACVSLGYSKVHVYDKLKVRIISTGDEILSPEENVPLGKTRDINSYSIYALCKKLGLQVVAKKHVKDDKDLILKELEADDIDILIISGSSSKGNKDFVPTLISNNFKPGLLIHGIAIKPGKPTSFSSDGKKIILGLPGHPVSAYTVFKTFFERGLNSYFDAREDFSFPANLSRNIASTPGSTKIQYVSLEKSGSQLIANPVFAASGNISLLKKADAYFMIGQDEEGKEQGETVWCKLI